MNIAKRIAPVLAGALLAAGLGASSASADIMSATYAGTLNYGVDELGLFGQAGASMVGQAFQANFTYDTALGTIQPFFAGTFLQGGSGYQNGSDLFMLSVSVTINNMTAQMTPLIALGSAELVPDHQLQAPGNHATGSVCHDGQQSVNVTPNFYACINTLDPVTSDYNTAFTVQADPLSNSLAAFIFPEMTLQGRPDSLVVERLGASPGPGVPEPSAWALLILGFGGAGAMLRRGPRRRVAA